MDVIECWEVSFLVDIDEKNIEPLIKDFAKHIDSIEYKIREEKDLLYETIFSEHRH